MKEEVKSGVPLCRTEKEKAWIESENRRVLKEAYTHYLLYC